MKLFSATFLFLIILTSFFPCKIAHASEIGLIECTVKISICGNIVKEGGEDCDNSDLNGQTCQSRGFSGGSLSCNSNCAFNTSQCTSGGGGGGGAYNPWLSPLSPEFQRTDANKDNIINFLDFNILMANWGAVGPNMADFNGDDIVDLFDFNLLMVYWTI